MFKKILIANRGEIALRIIRACHELGIETVAVYSSADELSLHVRFADEAVCIGPPPGSESYMNIPSILSAAELTNSDAIHPGYGFLSENPEFAQICTDNDFVFIGPPAETILSMGEKATAKKSMNEAGVPVIPGSTGVISSVGEAQKIASEIGFPVILKASVGGGGRGMRIVKEPDQLERAFATASSEARSAFNNGDLYLEKYVEKSRHIEIQILADRHGNVIHFGERECSIQRRHQKLIEESPSPIIDEELRQKIGSAAVQGAASIGYVGLGTVEFLFDSKSKEFYFMEMNTRIQVEHPVTEMVIGADLIKYQILCHAGISIPSWMQNIKLRGHSIECRINAEHPESFIPSPGKISQYHQPGGLGVRVDSAVYQGYKIPSHYDSMIGKLITFAETRNECISKMKRALEEYVIMGINTNIQLHQNIIQSDEFLSGKYDINYMSKFN